MKEIHISMVVWIYSLFGGVRIWHGQTLRLKERESTEMKREDDVPQDWTVNNT